MGPRFETVIPHHIMFNYNARQVFVPHPFGTGAGILSFLLSLDSSTAALNFKATSTEEKLTQWNRHLKGIDTNIDRTHDNTNAHLYDFINVGSANYIDNIQTADYCSTYVHKGHFYEFEHYQKNFQNSIFNKPNGELVSIGIYLTSACVERLCDIRPRLSNQINYYQQWIYSNQVKLMKDWFNVDTLHHFTFSEMLNEELFVDHIVYCKDILRLDIDIKTVRSIINEWHSKVLKV
jgi:hypothetical protein